MFLLYSHIRRVFLCVVGVVWYMVQFGMSMYGLHRHKCIKQREKECPIEPITRAEPDEESRCDSDNTSGASSDLEAVVGSSERSASTVSTESNPVSYDNQKRQALVSGLQLAVLRRILNLCGVVLSSCKGGRSDDRHACLPIGCFLGV